MSRRSWTLITTAVALICTTAESQAQRKQSLRNSLKSNFDSGPKVGKPLPDVSAFDAEGKTFKLRSLKGKHAVIVFGCLT